MRTLTIRYAEAPKGMSKWGPFLTSSLERAGFDPDRAIKHEISCDRRSVVYYQEEHATYEDVMKRLERIERLLNIQEGA